MVTKGGGGSKNDHFRGDVIFEWPLGSLEYFSIPDDSDEFSEFSTILDNVTTYSRNC